MTVKEQTVPVQSPVGCGIDMLLSATQSGKEFLKVSALCEGIKFCSRQMRILYKSKKRGEKTNLCCFSA